MAGREVREYTNLTDPKDRKLGKGKDRIDDEDITFQRMVAKLEILKPLYEDHGFSYRMVDAHRCKRLLENVEATFMDVAHWTVMICSISRSRWKLRKMLNAFYDALRNSDSSPASVPLALRVESKPKSGIRQQDLLKKVVEIKPKRQRVSSQSDVNQATPNSTERALASLLEREANQEEKKVSPLSEPTKAEDATQVENPVKSLLAAYESSEDEDFLDVYGTIEGKPENHVNDLTDLASATRIARDLIYGYSVALASPV
ncbi:unnamed protein product [Camellia sinensis]